MRGELLGCFPAGFFQVEGYADAPKRPSKEESDYQEYSAPLSGSRTEGSARTGVAAETKGKALSRGWRGFTGMLLGDLLSPTQGVLAMLAMRGARRSRARSQRVEAPSHACVRRSFHPL